MPLPIVAVIAGIVAAVVVVVDKAIDAAKVVDGAYSWFASGEAAELIAGRVNTRLAAAGLDLVIPAEAISFSPLGGDMPEKLKKILDQYACDKINAKTGAGLTTLEGLDRDTFLASISGVFARQINAKTGANLSQVWPLDKLQAQLQTEVVRQFNNRGRYAGGALFRANTMMAIKTKIAAKHPELLKQVKAVQDGGPWGPARNEAHRKKRESGKIRQDRYRQGHQQIWIKKS